MVEGDYRISLAAFLLAVCLAGCHPGESDKSQVNGANGVAATEAKAKALEQNAAAEGGNTVPSPSEVIAKPDAQSVDPNGKERLDDPITCLARSIYWEARGEEPVSMEAVASVVMNWLGHEGFPKTVCGVVRQGNERGACQFSWWCDGRSDQATDEQSYATAKEIARRALNLQLRDRTRGALYFHHRDVTPGWSREYRKTAEIGEFVFYRPRGGDAK